MLPKMISFALTATYRYVLAFAPAHTVASAMYKHKDVYLLARLLKVHNFGREAKAHSESLWAVHGIDTHPRPLPCPSHVSAYYHGTKHNTNTH
jgi:hypothetical protein